MDILKTLLKWFPVTVTEVKRIVSQQIAGKALGEDILPPEFFKGISGLVDSFAYLTVNL